MHTRSSQQTSKNYLSNLLFIIYIAFLTFVTTYSYLSHSITENLLDFDLGYSQIEVEETDEGIEVANTGNVSCYVRVAVNVADSDQSIEFTPGEGNLWVDDYAQDGEGKLCGYYYFPQVIEAGASTPYLNVTYEGEGMIYAESVQKGAYEDYEEAWEDFL